MGIETVRPGADDARTHFVYRTFNADGELLYVGCSKQPEKRWAEHRQMKGRMCEETVKFRVQGPYTREVALRIERDAIRSEQPLYGWTPVKGEERRKRNRWTKSRIQELLAEGVALNDAVECAVAQCAELFPDPFAHHF